MAARGNQDVDLPGKMTAFCWQKIAIAGKFKVILATIYASPPALTFMIRTPWVAQPCAHASWADKSPRPKACQG